MTEFRSLQKQLLAADAMGDREARIRIQKEMEDFRHASNDNRAAAQIAKDDAIANTKRKLDAAQDSFDRAERAPETANKALHISVCKRNLDVAKDAAREAGIEVK